MSCRLFSTNISRKPFIINLQIFLQRPLPPYTLAKKKPHCFSSVNVLNLKVRIRETVFSVFFRLPLEQESRTWPSVPREGLVVCQALVLILLYSKTLSIFRPRISSPLPPSLQSISLPTELYSLTVYKWEFFRPELKSRASRGKCLSKRSVNILSDLIVCKAIRSPFTKGFIQSIGKVFK